YAQRRIAGEPVARILGAREFWGLSLRLSEATLVPRPDTETLVERALQRFPQRDRPLRLLDIGAGSGCLVVTLLRLFPAATAVATDISGVALGWAKRNAQRLGVSPRLILVQSSWASAAGGPFDLIVSNPPYIAGAEIAGLMPDVSAFEPHLALDGGPDGLVAYRAILGDLPRVLAPDGLALLEVGHDQAGPVAALASGWRVATHLDLAGVSRCLELRRASY
ncbi:MAG: peptide chain release factor N(5)-glutamine methyltransferase, partial [Geminicoccaceae bacterium]